MTFNELIASVKSDILDDENSLWSDTRLLSFAKEALLEASKSMALLDGTVVIGVSAGVGTYDLEPQVKQILRVKLDSQRNDLEISDANRMQLECSSTWRITEGTPRRVVREKNTITLYPKPVANDGMVIYASMYATDSTVPDDIAFEYQHGLRYYIAYKCYSLRDADSFDAVKAADYLRQFHDFFGMAKSAKWLETAKQQPLYSTIIGGRMA